jgi:hypothetical protein
MLWWRAKKYAELIVGREKAEGGGRPGIVLLGPAYYLRAEQAPRLNRV